MRYAYPPYKYFPVWGESPYLRKSYKNRTLIEGTWYEFFGE